jgi:hypothetical protein
MYSSNRVGAVIGRQPQGREFRDVAAGAQTEYQPFARELSQRASFPRELRRASEQTGGHERAELYTMRSARDEGKEHERIDAPRIARSPSWMRVDGVTLAKNEVIGRPDGVKPQAIGFDCIVDDLCKRPDLIVGPTASWKCDSNVHSIILPATPGNATVSLCPM